MHYAGTLWKGAMMASRTSEWERPREWPISCTKVYDISRKEMFLGFHQTLLLYVPETYLCLCGSSKSISLCRPCERPLPTCQRKLTSVTNFISKFTLERKHKIYFGKKACARVPPGPSKGSPSPCSPLWQQLLTKQASPKKNFFSGGFLGCNPYADGLWHFSSEYKPLLRLYQNSPWFPSEYHPTYHLSS